MSVDGGQALLGALKPGTTCPTVQINDCYRGGIGLP